MKKFNREASKIERETGNIIPRVTYDSVREQFFTRAEFNKTISRLQRISRDSSRETVKLADDDRNVTEISKYLYNEAKLKQRNENIRRTKLRKKKGISKESGNMYTDRNKYARPLNVSFKSAKDVNRFLNNNLGQTKKVIIANLIYYQNYLEAVDKELATTRYYVDIKYMLSQVSEGDLYDLIGGNATMSLDFIYDDQQEREKRAEYIYQGLKSIVGRNEDLITF